MKKICTVLSLVLLITTASLFAQPKKGSVILGGDLGIDYINYSTNLKNESSSDIFVVRILPEIGFFTSDKVAIGLNFGFEYGKASYYDTAFFNNYAFTYYTVFLSESKEKIIVLQPFISTFHFFSDRIGIKNYFYAGAAFGSGNQMSPGSPQFNDNTVLRFTAGYELRFLFFLKESMAFNMGLVGLQYLNEAFKYDAADLTFKTQHLQFNSPFKNSLSVGLEFYLNGKPSAEKK